MHIIFFAINSSKSIANDTRNTSTPAQISCLDVCHPLVFLHSTRWSCRFPIQPPVALQPRLYLLPDPNALAPRIALHVLDRSPHGPVLAMDCRPHWDPPRSAQPLRVRIRMTSQRCSIQIAYTMCVISSPAGINT